jgi:hypothetical protein
MTRIEIPNWVPRFCFCKILLSNVVSLTNQQEVNIILATISHVFNDITFKFEDSNGWEKTVVSGSPDP